MRAATHIGMVFVGGSARQAAPPPDEEGFHPGVLAPKPEIEKLWAAISDALSERAAFWQEELMRWTDEFGIKAVEKLEQLIR